MGRELEGVLVELVGDCFTVMGLTGQRLATLQATEDQNPVSSPKWLLGLALFALGQGRVFDATYVELFFCRCARMCMRVKAGMGRLTQASFFVQAWNSSRSTWPLVRLLLASFFLVI